MSRPTSLVFAAFVLLLAATPTAGNAQSDPPDLVRTRDGGLFRGTIVENLPGDHVTLRLPTGETRVFAYSDVSVAGSVSEVVTRPAATSPPPVDARSSARPSARLSVRAGGRPVMLIEQIVVGMTSNGAGTTPVTSSRPLCTAPCELVLDFGLHEFALSDTRGRFYPVFERFRIEGDGELRVDIESRRGPRIRRWIFGSGLLAVAVPLLVFAFANPSCDSCTPNWGLGIPGIGAAVAGLGTGLWAAFTFDRGRVEYARYR